MQIGAAVSNFCPQHRTVLATKHIGKDGFVYAADVDEAVRCMINHSKNSISVKAFNPKVPARLAALDPDNKGQITIDLLEQAGLVLIKKRSSQQYTVIFWALIVTRNVNGHKCTVIPRQAKQLKFKQSLTTTDVAVIFFFGTSNNLYNWLYHLYNCCTVFEFVLGPRLVGSEGTRSARRRRVAAGRPPPGGPVRLTGKNTRSSRVTSALRASVLY